MFYALLAVYLIIGSWPAYVVCFNTRSPLGWAGAACFAVLVMLLWPLSFEKFFWKRKRG